MGGVKGTAKRTSVLLSVINSQLVRHMLRNHEEHTPTLVDRALGASAGKTCLAKARERLLNDIRRDRFSSERAAGVYTSSIDDAVWAYVEASPLGRIIYRNHLTSLERLQRAQHFADAFAREVGADEGRTLPRWLLFGT
jgi:4-hydroxyphenylpyruvate dioxygenase-like putative hemolysin